MNKNLLLVFFLFFFFLNSYCQEKNTEPYKVLKGHKHKVQRAFFSPNGKYLIAGTPESEILTWEMKTVAEKR